MNPAVARPSKKSQALVLGLAAASVGLAHLWRHYSVTSSLLCLLAVTSMAQTYGMGAGLAVTAGTERDLRLSQQLQEAELSQAREKLYQALLDSISHALRIPLVSITGVLSSLLESDLSVQADARQDMLENALLEAERLRRLVDNLLQMTRLEAGVLKIRKQPYDMGEVLAAVLDGLGPQLEERSVELEVADDLPLVPQDPILIGQVLRNLLDNALKYSPPGSPLRLEASSLDTFEVRVSLPDHGRGIDQDDELRVLEKFYRGRHQNTHGSGLGLSICDGLIAAHGGQLQVRSHPEGGTEASFPCPPRPQVNELNPARRWRK